MKKDDIILIRIVSVAVLLAALALIIVFGARISLFDSICDEIYLGNITDKNRTYKVVENFKEYKVSSFLSAKSRWYEMYSFYY